MYVKDGTRELVLEFRAFSPDGRWIEFVRREPSLDEGGGSRRR